MDPKLLDRLTYLVVAFLALMAFAMYKGAASLPPPPAQPSVPSPIAPAYPAPNCAGTCNPAKRRHGPFRVVCPNCRNLLNVQEPETGDTVAGAEPVAEKATP